MITTGGLILVIFCYILLIWVFRLIFIMLIVKIASGFKNKAMGALEGKNEQ